MLIRTGEEEWIPDPKNPFDEPEWVTTQRLSWLNKKKRKQQFKQDTIDNANLCMQQRKIAREKRIERANNKKARTAKALAKMRENRLKNAVADSDDEETSTVASSTVASKKSSSKSKRKPKTPTSTPKVLKKKRVVKPKSKFPDASETPDEQKVSRYFVTPQATFPNEAPNPPVPITISTDVSTQASKYSEEFWSPPFGSIRTYDHSLASEDLPKQLEPKYDTNDINSVDTATPVSKNLPFSAMHKPGGIPETSGRCRACKFHFEDCMERKYRDYCLQAVKTHIDEVGFEGTTDFSIRKAFHNEYMSQVRRDLREKYGKYENNHMLQLPVCMMKGSLEDAIELASGSPKGLTINEWLMNQRVYGIMDRVKEREDERALLESGARLAAEEDFMDSLRFERKKAARKEE